MKKDMLMKVPDLQYTDKVVIHDKVQKNAQNLQILDAYNNKII